MNTRTQCSAKSWMLAIVAAVFAFLASAATAEIVTTEQMLQQSDHGQVQQFLNREAVAEKLKTLGVAPEEARGRVDAMTPDELQVVAGKIDTLAVGGELNQTDWIVVLLTIIVVLLVV